MTTDTEWVVVLDPAEVAAAGRVELALYDNAGGILVGPDGIDWGDAAIQSFLADQTWGSSQTDFRVPNRTVTIPLLLGGDGNQSEFDANRRKLTQKVALFQRERGTIKRQTSVGSVYADVVEATLHHPDQWGATGAVESVTLTLVCLPDFYGDEITLDTMTATGVLHAKLKASTVDAIVQGDHPARCRIIVSDTSGNDQKGVAWGVRAKHYDSASTAALFYEAENMTILSGGSSITHTGASNGHTVSNTLPAGSWVPILSTDVSGSPLTHSGSYRVWVRAYSLSASPQLRLVWGSGSLAAPIANGAVTVPSAQGSADPNLFYLMDLGVIRIDAPPVGNSQWSGAIQAQVATVNDPVEIDCLYFQPLDDGAGCLSYIYTDPPSVISSQGIASTAANDNGNGSGHPWYTIGTPGTLSNPVSGWGNYFNQIAPNTNTYTEELDLEGYGFAIPSGATIDGIKVSMIKSGPGISTGVTSDRVVSLTRSGSKVGSNRALLGQWPTSGTPTDYGGPSDLWGTTWTPAQVNSSTFGVAISANISTAVGFYGTVYVYGPLIITVYYTLATGFSIDPDAVVYASQTAELRTDGMFREDSSGSVYGNISQVIGDLPRLAPSGLEDRAVELFVKPSRGDLAMVPDSALDSLSVVVKYRPSFLFRI